MYIKSGSTGHTFKCIISNNETLAVKVVAYSKNSIYGDNIDDVNRPENCEL